MKKVAVFLRGHLRTWEYNKDNIFKFCDSLADQVDYYVAVWKTGNDFIRFDKLREDFNNKQLKKFKVVSGHWDYNAWSGPTYLSNLLTQTKVEEEISSGQTYDAVLDTRFDVMFDYISGTTISPPKTRHIGTTLFEPEMTTISPPFEPEILVEWQGLEDHCLLIDGSIHTIMSHRLHYHNAQKRIIYPDNHVKLQNFSKHYKLTPYQIDWFNCNIIRPSIIDVAIDGKHADPYIIEHRWQKYSQPERVDCLNRCGIELEEYEGWARAKNTYQNLNQ